METGQVISVGMQLVWTHSPPPTCQLQSWMEAGAVGGLAEESKQVKPCLSILVHIHIYRDFG